jgi:hypothetical protein
MIHLIHFKDLCKYYNVPPPSTTIKKERKKKDVVDGEREGEVAQIMYTHVSKCKHNKRKKRCYRSFLPFLDSKVVAERTA